MPRTRRYAISIIAVSALLAAIGALTLAGGPAARALPSAGTDVLSVQGKVSIDSLLGSESITLSGTITVQRSDPRLEGGVEVVDMEIVAMNLTGLSLTGPVTITENPPLASLGELRSLQPSPPDFPASSFFDVFMIAEVPAAPTATVFLHNDVALHPVPTSGGGEVSLTAWPPSGVTYTATPGTCVPLLPAAPAEVCVTSLAFTVTTEPSTPTPTATPTATPSATPTPGPTPTPKDAAGDTDGDTITNDVDPDDDNDGCADVREISGSPAVGGLRDPHYFWDFFDPDRNQSIAFVDFLKILQHFGTNDSGGTAPINRNTDPLAVPDPGPGIYHPLFDRGAVIGPNGWNVAPPDGAIAFPDFLTLLVQFTHTCS